MKFELNKTRDWDSALHLASEGWELVSVGVFSGEAVYFFKREIKEKEALKDKARPLRKLSTGDK